MTNKHRPDMHVSGKKIYRKPTYSKVKPVVDFTLLPAVSMEDDYPIKHSCAVTVKSTGKTYCRKALIYQSKIISEMIVKMLDETVLNYKTRPHIKGIIHINKGFYKNDCITVDIYHHTHTNTKKPNEVYKAKNATLGFSIILRFGHYNNDYHTLALANLPFYAYLYEYPITYFKMLLEEGKFDTLITRRIYALYGKEYNKHLDWFDLNRPMRTNAKMFNNPGNVSAYGNPSKLYWDGDVVINNLNKDHYHNFACVNGFSSKKSIAVMNANPPAKLVNLTQVGNTDQITMQNAMVRKVLLENAYHGDLLVEYYMYNASTSEPR